MRKETTSEEREPRRSKRFWRVGCGFALGATVGLAAGVFLAYQIVMKLLEWFGRGLAGAP